MERHYVVIVGAETTEISCCHWVDCRVEASSVRRQLFCEQIINYIRREHNFVIGRKSAEQIKKELLVFGSYSVDEKVDCGRDANVVKGLPGEVLRVASSRG